MRFTYVAVLLHLELHLQRARAVAYVNFGFFVRRYLDALGFHRFPVCSRTSPPAEGVLVIAGATAACTGDCSAAIPRDPSHCADILPLICGIFGIDDIRTRCHSRNSYSAASKSG